MSPSIMEAAPAANGVSDTLNKLAAEAKKVAETATRTNGESELKGDTKDEDATPEGALCECKPLYQQKDKDGKYQWVAEEPEDVVEAAEGKETAKYAFLVRKKKSYDSRKKYDIDSIIVQSPLLKESLGKVLKDYPGITTTLQRLVFKAPFQPFVHRWTHLVALLDAKATKNEETRSHLQLFHDVLYEELEHAIKAKIDLVKNGVISFEFLWTILEPGKLIFAPEDGKERVFQLNSSHTATDSRRGLEFQSLSCWCVDMDSDKFGQSSENLAIYEFAGTAKITSLRAFPLDFHPQKQALVERLTSRGKLFENFFGYHYQAYQGVALGYGRCGMVKYNLDSGSRVILDTEAYNKFLPNNAVYFGSLGLPGKQDKIVSNDLMGDADDIDIDDEDDEDVNYDDYDSDSYDEVPILTPSTGASDAKPKHRSLTEKELILSVPYVRGYSIKIKKWLWFFVDQISPIKFNDNAFGSLVLPNEQKSVIRCFVEQSQHADDFDDIISGKGKGMIMLLAGPPGVGKTLTAESVSEHLRVPLYMMSAGDLGLNPSGIEDALGTIFDMVAKWKAVLLLDEADVFLEARSTHDLERNKMVSIFLRVLEYYEGILFLTTNRIKNIDDAFHSRIHCTLNYPNLSADSRKHIWKTFLGKHHSLGEKDLEYLSQQDLNGRQIKNMLKTSRMLARSEKGPKKGEASKVDMKHIQTVLAIEKGNAWE